MFMLDVNTSPTARPGCATILTEVPASRVLHIGGVHDD